jgi:hypothetical protein
VEFLRPASCKLWLIHCASGNVFEKRLIEAYVSEHGTDPVTGEEISPDDVIELKTARVVRPRPPTLTSIPSLLGVFQEEWDALALETFTLRQTLAQTRQELSTALYQHDAAVRVIARLRKERDEYRDTLSKISVGGARAPTNGDAMQVDSTGLAAEVVSRIEATQERYLSLPFLSISLHTDTLHQVYQKRAGSVPSPTTGPRPMLSRNSSTLGTPSRSILAENLYLSTRLATWPSLEV